MKKLRRNLFLAILFIGALFVWIFILVLYPDFVFKKKIDSSPATSNEENTNNEVATSSNTVSEENPVSRSAVLFLKQNISVKIELADTPYKWAKGLMYRESLGENKGMLFVFPDEQIRSFWMKNTLIPLDMIFISSDKKIVGVKENALPCKTFSCETYSSEDKAMYVLEVNGGFIKKNGIQIGDQIKIN